MPYLTTEEIPVYCTVIPGVTSVEVNIASQLIDAYIGRAIESKQYKENVSINKKNRGKLKHFPVISIDSVKAKSITIFGVTEEDIPVSDIYLDPDGDGYFTFIYSSGLNYLVYGNVPNSLEITYTAGYETVPEDIKYVCAMLAQNIKQKSSFAGEKEINTLDFRVAMTSDSFFTSDMRLILSKYKGV